MFAPAPAIGAVLSVIQMWGELEGGAAGFWHAIPCHGSNSSDRMRQWDCVPGQADHVYYYVFGNLGENKALGFMHLQLNPGSMVQCACQLKEHAWPSLRLHMFT